jgi:deoxycytidine triphosphate deaminase
MNRNADYIYTKLIDESGLAQKAQVGVDLSIGKIEVIKSDELAGVPKNTIWFDDRSKVHNIKYEEAAWIDQEEPGGSSSKIYCLEPHTEYAIEFQQKLKKLNSDEWGLVVQRSSFLRAGIHIISSIWDPGFTSEPNYMGTTLVTGNTSVRIPVGTRAAQLLIFRNEPVSEEYHGQWQGKANK